MMSPSEKLEHEVSLWPQLSVHPHQFAAREFRFGKAEVGHVHAGGILDIPFPRSIRDALLAEGLAEEHQWAPNSGWVAFHIRDEHSLQHALWLLRLSYLRYALKTADNPRALLDQERQALNLTPHFTNLLAQLIPANPVAST